MWALAGLAWTSWRSPVTAFDPATKKISFRTFVGTGNEDWVVSYHNPTNGAGGATFYVSGAAKLLDAPKEWYYDTVRSALRVVPPAGFTPGTDLVEVQTRQDAIDLSGLNYVKVEGFRVLAGGVNLTTSNGCTLKGLNVSYPSFTRADFGTHVISGRTGVYVVGNNNTVRECEVSWSWGSGIVLNGNDNRVINNYIHHVNLIGTTATGILVYSGRNLVAWNTIVYTGRDGLIPNGTDHKIVHNRISKFGQICDDTGGVYLAGGGLGVELGYNWVSDAPPGMKSGIYMDSFTTGFLVHHNIIWDVPMNAIQVNRPGCYHSIYHNTVFGKISNDVSVKSTLATSNLRNSSIGMQVANNLLSGSLSVSFGATSTTNLTSVTSMGFDPNTREILPDRDGKGGGKFVEGFSPAGYPTPDIGAIQTGVEYPTPGHNFAIHREIEYVASTQPVRQLLKNAVFLDGLDNWTPAGGAVTTVTDNNWDYPENRNTISNSAVALSGDGRVEQTVTDLVPGKIYSLWAIRKESTTMTTGFGIVFPDGSEYRYIFNSATTNWQIPEYFEFVVPAGITSGKVFLWMEGSGTAYFDNIGLMQKWYSDTLHYDPTRFKVHPADQSAAVGGGVTFSATSELNSTRVNRWEWLAPPVPINGCRWLPLPVLRSTPRRETFLQPSSSPPSSPTRTGMNSAAPFPTRITRPSANRLGCR